MFSAVVHLANGGTEEIEVYNRHDVEFPILDFEDPGKGAKKTNARYYKCIAALDTETSKKTHFEEVKRGKDTESVEMVDGCWVYQWCIGIDDVYVAGRTAQELIGLLHDIHTEYQLDKSQRMVVWVHNLAYDASYLLNGLYKEFEGKVKLFATGQRRPIRIELGGGLELRCSWKLVNKSLAAWCEDVQPRHKKLVGAIDYNTIRTPQSELSQVDWDYMLNDVICMQECIADRLRGEKLRTVPMTSTGFVRRSMQRAARKDKRWNEFFKENLPTARQYIMMHEAFTGGYTHANSLALGIWHDIQGYDAASMYPAVLAVEKYPAAQWHWSNMRDLKMLDKWCADPDLAVIVKMSFSNIRLKDMFCWNPYISFSKAKNAPPSRTVLDNGKVVESDFLTITLCDVDYNIVMDQYDFDWCTVHDVMIAPEAPLPEWFLSTMRKWYADKVRLKSDKTESGARRYMESKHLLNAIYGMTATAWVHEVYSYDFTAQDWAVPVAKDNIASVQEQIDKMRKPYSKAFLPYSWGLYTTAYARKRLFDAAQCCNFPLYCDTDSVKGADWDMEALEKFNEDLRRKSDNAGFTMADPTRRLRPIGVFEEDGRYSRFSALHAKCYAYEDESTGKLHATIAGVTRDNGYPIGDPRRITKEEELGTLEGLKDGKVFTACGGTRAVYMQQEHDIVVNGEHIHSFGGCAILDTTYEVGGINNLLAMYGISDPELPYK